MLDDDDTAEWPGQTNEESKDASGYAPDALETRKVYQEQRKEEEAWYSGKFEAEEDDDEEDDEGEESGDD